MSNNDHAKGKGLAIGAAIGAVAGVITGILFAPKSGKETREDVKHAAVNAKNKLDEESKMVQAELTKIIEKVESLAKEKGSVLSDKVHETLDYAKKTKTDLASKAKDLKDGTNTNDKDLQIALKKAQEAQAALTKFLKK